MVSSSRAASLYCALVFASLLLLSSSRKAETLAKGGDAIAYTVKGAQILERPCDEIYVVGEGETLHSISAKCGDPFIVERNPHVHDPDDVYPGLVLKIVPSLRSRN
ncbi:hypothetical protein BT93_D2218 [Corymbia citriodora subsp. variegata]|nr:hypothetical protein BT93_D2121 [Corymbia citriodora subsp. variegata]KAF8033554.1 hypothetical protein BT93_D2218 [Corymbia citriodora subsp. variegata]